MKNSFLRQERINRDWTQEQVGKKVGVSNAIHDIETGKQKPPYDVLVKLENLFNKLHRYLLEQAEDTIQENYNSSGQNGVVSAKELNEADRVTGSMSL